MNENSPIMRFVITKFKDISYFWIKFVITNLKSPLRICIKFATEDGDYSKEIKPEPKHGNLSIFSDEQNDSQVRSNQQLGGERETKGENGVQNLENASTLSRKKLLEHHQIKDGGKQNKDFYAIPLEEWELLNYEQMKERKQWPLEQVSKFPSVADHDK